MKKITPIFILCMILLLCIPVYAKEASTIITGYTENGIYYEVVTLEEHIDTYMTTRGKALNVTKEFTYNGIITPSSTISWTESSGSITYSGILNLQSFYYNNNKTVATYKGTLYSQ